VAQLTHRVDLTLPEFPMLSSELGRTVLVPASRDSDTGEKENLPEILYCHNVLPTKRGLISVGYEEIIPATIGVDSNTTFDDTRIIFGNSGNRVEFAITTDGAIYALELGDTAWRKLTSIPASAGVLVTLGTVNGQTYIHWEGIGGYQYDEATHDLVTVTYLGLALNNIIGITASSGYLLAYNAFDVAWSSTINPLDFVPNPVTGAGGGTVSDTEGLIVFIVPNSLGLMVYTAANCVSAQYTGNAQFPFRFKSVDNSKGAIGLDLVAYESNASEHFSYTKAGLQAIDVREAKIIVPEVTDFLSGEQFEDYDELTDILSTTNLTTTMKKKVKLIASRHLIISYGITEFTHAIVYDLALKRLGKLKITHVDVLEYLGSQLEIGKHTLAFLTKTGMISILEFASHSTARPGVLLLGRFQYIRDRHLVLQRVTAQNIAPTNVFKIIDKVSLDGLTTTDVVGAEVITGNIRTVSFRSSGINHVIALIGHFSLYSLQMLFTVGGRR